MRPGEESDCSIFSASVRERENLGGVAYGAGVEADYVEVVTEDFDELASASLHHIDTATSRAT